MDPAARFSLRESVSLAFTAALQALPPRQRAVLILRDVLAWPAGDAAEVLGMSTSAVNSALNRARVTLASRRSEEGLAEQIVPISDPADRRLLDAYMRAWESDDMDGLVATLRQEVRLAMPPSPAWFNGRVPVIELLRRWVMPMGPFRMHPSGANMQPAAVLCAIAPDGSERPIGVHVLTLEEGGIAVIDAFMDPELAARFWKSADR
jgi:RNA polymerase sigma-70 factor (ECF subfamily)